MQGRQTDAAKLLIDSKCDVNCTNKLGNTALHLSLRKGYTDATKLLIDSDCDVTCKNKWGYTAFHDLASTLQHLDVVERILLEPIRFQNILNRHETIESVQYLAGILGMTDSRHRQGILKIVCMLIKADHSDDADISVFAFMVHLVSTDVCRSIPGKTSPRRQQQI